MATVALKKYRIDFATDLVGDDWDTVDQDCQALTTGVASWTDPEDRGDGFYRVVLLP